MINTCIPNAVICQAGEKKKKKGIILFSVSLKCFNDVLVT